MGLMKGNLKNPFSYGEAVRGVYFADRKEELDSLVGRLKQPIRIFLISSRRYGKTSLIVNALARLKEQGYLCAYLDLYKVASLEKFVAQYAKALAIACESKLDSIVRLVKETISGISPKISISPSGEISISLETILPKKEIHASLENLYDTPEKIAKNRNKRFIVVFDEFQEIITLGGEAMEKSMRASIQHHHNVSYLFAGSKKTIMTDMVSNRSRAFYKMGKVLFLDKIPEDEFIGFIQERFKQTGFKIQSQLGKEIMKVTESIPYYVQYLCSELWTNNLWKKSVKKEDLHGTISNLVKAQSPLYLTIWDSFTLPQRRLLQAIVVSGGRNIFSHDFIRENQLGPLATVQTSLRLLLKKDIIEKENETYRFTDIWFKEWVRMTTI